MDETNLLKLNAIVVETVDDFVKSVDVVKSKIHVQTSVCRTSYGSRVFIRIKFTKSDRSLVKMFAKISTFKELESFTGFLLCVDNLCSSFY